MDRKFLEADELGVRLELVHGLPIWEPYPVYKHQRAVDRIRETIRRAEGGVSRSLDCSYIHVADIYVSFPGGSLKRPDIAIFCEEPQEDEEAVTLIPEAVVEVISKGLRPKTSRSARSSTWPTE